MKKLYFAGVILLSLFAQSAMADLLGLANGRSANLDNMSDMSVDAGINIDGDGNLLGVRGNFKMSPDIMLFGGLGRLSIDDVGGNGDGLVYGFGAYYQMRNVTLLENTDFAVKGAYHLGTLEAGDSEFFGDIDLDYTEISIEALISGDQLGDTDYGWYANLGMHILEVDVSNFSSAGSSDTELGFGGGIIGSLSFGEFFAGVDFIDGALLVAGIRYNL